MASPEPEVVAEVTPEIQLELVSATSSVETQAQPPQVSLQEELMARLHSMGSDMLTAAQFLAGWAAVTLGSTSTPNVENAVSPITVTAGTMQQLIMPPGVQIASIPLLIPLSVDQPMYEGPVTYQSHLWVEGHDPTEKGNDEERVVELELDKETEPPSQEDEPEETTEKEKASGKRSMETSEEESGESPRGHDTRSTLTSEEDSEQEAEKQHPAPTSPLHPIPSLMSLGEPTSRMLSSAHFDPDDQQKIASSTL